MKGFIWICLAVAWPFTLAVNTNSTQTFALLSQLPQCALTCLAQSVSNSTCSPTDNQCICTNVPLNTAITTCVQSTCTIKQSLVTLNITHTLCEDPIRDKRTFYNVLSNVFAIASGISVVLRFYSRYISAQNFWFDDWAIVFVMVIGIPSSVMNVQGLTHNGLGLDIWRVGFRQITDFIHVFFAMELLYFAQVGAVKLSLLFFYLRLFPSPAFRKVVWGTIAFNTIFTLLFVFIGLFQCAPIRYYWKRWDYEHRGTCMDINALGWVNAGISIALDVWMLGLPMTQLTQLNLGWKRKLSVAAMFGVGAFVTIVSIIRLQSLVKFSRSQNPTWDYIAIGYWSTIEINVGIICACMPNIRLLLVRAFPGVMGTTYDRSYVYTGNRERKNQGSSANAGSNGARSAERGPGEFLPKAPNDTEELGTSNIELVRVRSERFETKKDGGDPEWI